MSLLWIASFPRQVVLDYIRKLAKCELASNIPLGFKLQVPV